MLKNVVVEVEPRSESGKNESRRLRAAGRVPGIVYGMKRPPFSVAVSPRRLEEVLLLESGRNTIFKLSLAGQDQTRAVMIKELQRDPVTDLMIHVDFVRVDLQKSVKVHVPVRILGAAFGVKTEGGIVEFITRHVEVECLPEDIPEHLDVDVSELHIHQHASVSNLVVAPRVKLLADPHAIVVVIAPPRAEEEVPAASAEAAAVPAAAEPEVIKKGKEASGGVVPPSKEKEKK